MSTENHINESNLSGLGRVKEKGGSASSPLTGYLED